MCELSQSRTGICARLENFTFCAAFHARLVSPHLISATGDADYVLFKFFTFQSAPNESKSDFTHFSAALGTADSDSKCPRDVNANEAFRWTNQIVVFGAVKLDAFPHNSRVLTRSSGVVFALYQKRAGKLFEYFFSVAKLVKFRHRERKRGKKAA